MGQDEKLNPARTSLAGFMLMLAAACSQQPVAAPSNGGGGHEQPRSSGQSRVVDRERTPQPAPTKAEDRGPQQAAMGPAPEGKRSTDSIAPSEPRTSKLVITLEPKCGRPGDRLRASTRTVPLADIAWGVEYPDGSNHGEYGITKADAEGKATWIIRVGTTAPTGAADLMAAASKTAEFHGGQRYQASGRVAFEVSPSC